MGSALRNELEITGTVNVNTYGGKAGYVGGNSGNASENTISISSSGSIVGNVFAVVQLKAAPITIQCRSKTAVPLEVQCTAVGHQASPAAPAVIP